MDNLLRLYIGETLIFALCKRCVFLGIHDSVYVPVPHDSGDDARNARVDGREGDPKSYFMSVDVRLITVGHVSISQKCRQSDLRVHRKDRREQDLLAAENTARRRRQGKGESVVNLTVDGYHRGGSARG